MKKKIVLLILFCFVCFAEDYSSKQIDQIEKTEFLKKLNFGGKKYVPVQFSKLPRAMRRKLD